jgi:glutamate-5-semialdehyde dehydrogenase
LKGGKEAERTCRLLAEIVQSAIESVECSPALLSSAVSLASTREDVAQLLGMHQVEHFVVCCVLLQYDKRILQYIDLVIPRGSASLVKYVSENTKIPVLGHSEGICHVYLDEHASVEVAVGVTGIVCDDMTAAVWMSWTMNYVDGVEL